MASLKDRFGKFAKQLKETQRENIKKGQEEHQNYIQLLKQGYPLVRKVCKEFAKAFHYKFSQYPESDSCRYSCYIEARRFKVLDSGWSSIGPDYIMITVKTGPASCVEIKTCINGDRDEYYASLSLEKLTEGKLAERLEQAALVFPYFKKS